MKLPNPKECESVLKAVDGRQRILETSVQSVCQGFTPAMFVWGPPGLGKSHILTTILCAIQGNAWKHHTAYSTPKGLMLSIAESPDSVHLFEDCERMLKTDLAASLLRAACGSPDGKPRWVTYETAHEKLRVNFTGGIIVATNQNLSKQNGPLQGVASRFRPMLWTLTLSERIALIATIARAPHRVGKITLTAHECTRVAAELIDMVEAQSLSTDLDLRLFCEHALPAFAHAKKTGLVNWQDVVHAKLIGQVGSKEEAQSEKTERLKTLAQMIASRGGTTKEKVAEWRAKTGLGQAIYYRHLRKGKST